jgi:hypothetical protein
MEPIKEKEPATARPSAIIMIASVVAGVVIAGKVVLAATAPLINPDTYFHLRFGQLLTGPWRPWRTGSLDHYGTAHWVPTQWLSELGMNGVESWWGLPGVAVLYAVVLVGLLTLWYAAVRRNADPMPTLLLTGLAFVIAADSLSARPQTISFVLATVVTLAWCRARESGRIPWQLVPLIWVWSMLHGMWILGVAISLVAVVALRLERRLPTTALLLPVAAFLATFATPAGPRLPLAVFQVNSRSAYFPEWAPPSFTSVTGVAALVLLGVGVLLLARSPGATLFEMAMIGTAAIFTVYSLRTVPVAACLLIPVIAPHLQALIGPRLAVSRLERVLVTGLAVLAVAATALIAPHTADKAPAFTSDFDAQFADLAPGTPVLTEWPDGGPLLWTHPGLDFPFHGYADVYTDQELSTYAGMFGLAPDWDGTLRGLGIRDALLPTDDALTYALRQAGWTRINTADDRVFLVAPTGW